MFQALFGSKKNKRGFAIIDALIAISIISVALITLLESGLLYINSSTLLEKKSRALLLLKDNMELARSFRDGTDWASDGLGILSTGSAYHFVLDTGTNPATVSMALGEETIGIYTRRVIIERVSRGIVNGVPNSIEDTYNSSNDDDDTRKITSIVEWEDSILQLSMYLTNWKQ